MHQRACAELELGEIGAAIKDWDQVITLSPKSSLALGCRGNAKRMTGDLAGAAADIDQSVRLAPTSSSAITFKSQLERTLGHGEEADRLMAKVKELKIQEQAGTADVAALLAAGRAAGEKDRKENQPRHARKAFNLTSPASATLSSGMDPEEVFTVGYTQGYDRTAIATQPVKAP
jgi:tetratricopeptide (TPR) repeat protein